MIFITFRLISYHIDVEVAQKGTYSLPDHGIVLPKHVGLIVKNKYVYNSVHLLVNLYKKRHFSCLLFLGITIVLRWDVLLICSDVHRMLVLFLGLK
jgi:hypothetical protein